jgi:hypothetical protein
VLEVVDLVVAELTVEVIVFWEPWDDAVEFLAFVCSFIALFISASMSCEFKVKYVRTPFSMAHRKKLSFPTVVTKGSSPGT